MGQRPSTEVRDHIARVQTTEAKWIEFRHTIGPTPVSRALGQLVEAELSRQRARRVRNGTASDVDLLTALDNAVKLYATVEQLVRRLEARLDRQTPDPQMEEW